MKVAGVAARLVENEAGSGKVYSCWASSKWSELARDLALVKTRCCRVLIFVRTVGRSSLAARRSEIALE